MRRLYEFIGGDEVKVRVRVYESPENFKVPYLALVRFRRPGIPKWTPYPGGEGPAQLDLHRLGCPGLIGLDEDGLKIVRGIMEGPAGDVYEDLKGAIIEGLLFRLICDDSMSYLTLPVEAIEDWLGDGRVFTVYNPEDPYDLISLGWLIP